jgi:hypothetical protein
MDVPSPHEPGFSQGSLRAIARVAALSVTHRSEEVNARFQLTRIIPGLSAAFCVKDAVKRTPKPFANTALPNAATAPTANSTAALHAGATPPSSPTERGPRAGPIAHRDPASAMVPVGAYASAQGTSKIPAAPAASAT